MVLSQKSPLFQSSHIITKSVIFWLFGGGNVESDICLFTFSTVLLWVGQVQLPALSKLSRTCHRSPYVSSPVRLTLLSKHLLPSCLRCWIVLLSIILISFLTSVDFLNKDSTIILAKYREIMSLSCSTLSNGFQFHFKLKINSSRWLKVLTWLTLPQFSKLVLIGFPDGLPCYSWSMQACPLPEDQESLRRLMAWICCLQYQKILFPLPCFMFFNNAFCGHSKMPAASSLAEFLSAPFIISRG